MLPLNLRNEVKISSFITPIQYSIVSRSHCNKARKGNESHTDWKRGNKAVLICR